ncbi:MAG: SusC/RagA family TonB-linked outer membrane protein, partial [Bacteroidales bacterium]|nr:SusC/RagA family TonB-linked outer membrane protein [Bacteroidales bacterium]
AIPGVTVMVKTGTPGTTGVHGNETEILIRGLSTWNNTQPLILIDGVQRPMSDVSVDEIENFTVLKDASAAAVYGLKGANGVILITTKRGHTGKPSLSFEVNSSLRSISKVEKPLGSFDALLARNWAVIHELPLMGSTQMAKYASPRVLGYYRDNIEPEKYTDVDWQDAMTKDQAMTAKYSVNVSGGTDFVKYFSTISFIDEGDIMNTGTDDNPRGYKNEFKYQRLNFRTNLDFNFTRSTTLRVNLSGYYGRQQAPDQPGNAIWPGIYKYNPATPLPIYSDGIFGAREPSMLSFYESNYYFNLLTGGTAVEKRTALASDFEIDQKLDFITRGLSVRGRFSFDNYFITAGSNISDTSDYIRKRFDVQSNSWVYIIPLSENNGFDFYPLPLGYTLESPNSSATRRNLYYELALNYNRTFGKHYFEGLALFSRQEYAQGSNWPVKREDWVGRVKYEYDGKYLFEVNGAYNGSEKFGSGHKFGLFPSVAVGWRVSEEQFINNSIPQISNLKLRYSIGWTGSDNLGNNAPQWGYLTTWDPYNR